jgi:hypothetical protein
MTPPSIRRIPAPEPRALASSTRARRPRPRPHSRCFPLSVSSPTAPPHRHHPRNPVSCATDPLSPRFHSTRHGSTLAPASTRLDTISPGALFSVFSRFFFPSPQRGSVEHHTPETLPPISRCPGSSLAPSPAPVPLLSSGSPSFFLSLSLRFGSCLRASPLVSSRAVSGSSRRLCAVSRQLARPVSVMSRSGRSFFVCAASLRRVLRPFPSCAPASLCVLPWVLSCCGSCCGSAALPVWQALSYGPESRSSSVPRALWRLRMCAVSAAVVALSNGPVAECSAGWILVLAGCLPACVSHRDCG